MKIVVDENMPKVADLFGDIAQIHYVDGRTLTAEQVVDADALLVRSVTKVNQNLLRGSKVKFVGSATIGTDHVDTSYLQAKNIAFASAPGCNADAVADYVLSALSYLYEQKGVAWLNASIGIVGYGNVGSKVYGRLDKLGCQLKVHDPFKKITDKTLNQVAAKFVSIEEIMSCDIVILHTPLTKTGAHPTQGMISTDLLNKLSTGACIISAGRGGVIDEVALLARYKELDGDLSLVFDVWMNEPLIDLSIMDMVDIATPHIAGYSLQGREKGTWMIYQAFCQFFDIQPTVQVSDVLSHGVIESLALSKHTLVRNSKNKSQEKVTSVNDTLHLKIARACHAIYNVSRDDAAMRQQLQHSSNTESFDFLRKHYVERDEFATCKVIDNQDKKTFVAVGFSE